MRRGKSKNSRHSAIAKWLLMINHKYMCTISFASCLQRKERIAQHTVRIFYMLFLKTKQGKIYRRCHFFPLNQCNWKRTSLQNSLFWKADFSGCIYFKDGCICCTQERDEGAWHPPAFWTLHPWSILYNLGLWADESTQTGREVCIQHPNLIGGLNQAHFCTVQVQEKDELSRPPFTQHRQAAAP